jgi:hypothetical protein
VWSSATRSSWRDERVREMRRERFCLRSGGAVRVGVEGATIGSGRGAAIDLYWESVVGDISFVGAVGVEGASIGLGPGAAIDL